MCSSILRLVTNPGYLLALFALIIAPNGSSAIVKNPGDVPLADAVALGGTGAIIKIDPETGAQTTIASGTPFIEFVDMIADAVATRCSFQIEDKGAVRK